MNQELIMPDGVFDQHTGVLGKTRTGKSSVMRSAFVEPLLDAGKPVGIIDPKGDWWGLKSSRDGKSDGYPIVIFGGDHADVPITDRSGKAVAELVATANRPYLIDLGGWRVGARTRFFIDFASTMFLQGRGKRWLVIDEVHNFAPQGAANLGGDYPEMLHWANRMASEGLGKGLALICASQRPQKVHKDFLTCMETLVAMKVLHKLDRDAVRDWMLGCGDTKLAGQIVDSLATLKRGTGWVWSPEIEFGPERVEFPLFKTYDSFKPQPVDLKRLKGWAAVDLDEVRERMADAVAEAEANDPKQLQKTIRDLRRQLSDASTGTGSAELDAIRKEMHEAVAHGEQLEARGRALERHADELSGWLDGFLEVAKVSAETLRTVTEQLEQLEAVPQAPAEVVPIRTDRQKQPPVVVDVKPAPAQETTGTSTDSEVLSIAPDLSKGEQRFLESMAFWLSVGVEVVTSDAVAGIMGIRSRGGSFSEPRSKLRAADLIEYVDGCQRLTRKGRAKCASITVAITSLDQLHTAVCRRFTGRRLQMLRTCIDNYPSPLSNEELAQAVGLPSARGGNFSEPRAKLRKLGLLVGGVGENTVPDFLFPDGLV